MSKKIPDLTGQRFGRLTVLRYAGIDERKYKSYECKCDCGTIKTVAGAKLHSGELQSCGCLLQEARNRNILKAQAANVTHGLAGTPEHTAWNTMLTRCYNRKHCSYENYGGRGITVCEFFREKPQNLASALGPKPHDYYSVDRMDSNGHYSCGKCEECVARGWPLNVKWSTPKEQAENRRNNIRITIDGQTKTCAEWARVMGRSFHWVRDHYKADEI